MNDIQLQKDTTFIDHLQESLDKENRYSPWDLFNMAYEAETTMMAPSFNGLRALDYLPHVNFLPHQVTCAEQVVEEMNGRAILADEVGLGKTIEAGLILKEYMIRGLVKKALILVPASLVNQWEKELNSKFYIPAIAHRRNYAWEQCDILISSIDTAKRSPHREQILEIDYDFILIDEAHKLKNHKTKNYEFVRSLTKKYCLLLTATPVQNRLVEIFNLVSILKPGHLGNYESFLEQYGKDRNQIKQDAYLKQLVQKVMIRNTRDSTDLSNAKRHIETIWIDFTDAELDFYQKLDSVLFAASFTKLTLLREICSSREACYLSLKKMADSENASEVFLQLAEKIEQLPHHAKAKKVVELIQQNPGEKVIIFTEYRATQLYLQWYLQQSNITSVPFRGGFKRGKKDWMRQLFRDHAQVLIATEAGGEGINLQFCNYMINYDLPWNPMRLEQRIGRIHRYGQEKDVHIYNFAVRGTVEEHIMTLLYEKINLFETVIGHLDTILADLNITDLEDEIKSIFSESTSTGEAKIKLDNLTSIIQYKHDDAVSEEQQYGN
ncbi:helicase [Lentibacillus populi]|uniref:Helicase n=1 Tax=Lentibacillus populi TaxID=1827502 RepID=A0A9W5X464_9BACI|nr:MULTISPECIES: SNF2-related protein [Bacillaceae]MBT2214441.1 DEAD/DEAH box helicase [Virgibacillus dakarensis]GGB29476.1 helicase [Lentibacillus populi]